jgi:thioredoxin-like negative regulator of GroEL
MATKRQVEVFSAGCPACDNAIQMIEKVACDSCEITVQDMNDPSVADRAKQLGVRQVPAVVLDGQLAQCCASGLSESALREAGIGQSRS